MDQDLPGSDLNPDEPSLSRNESKRSSTKSSKSDKSLVQEEQPNRSVSPVKKNTETVDVVQVTHELRRDLASMQKTMRDSLDMTSALVTAHTGQKHKWDGEVVKTIMSMRHEIKELFDDDQHTVATGSIGYQPWILTAQNHEYLEDLMANLTKGNEHYLATHKQVTGLMSMLMYKCLENKPLDNVAYIRRLLLSRKLKYYLNKYMLKNGYKRSPAQMDHELVFLEPSAKAHTRCCYENKADFKPTLEGGKFSLTPYGPPLPPKCQAFKKTYSASVVHGLIPYYIRTKEDEKIFVARDQAAWPSLFY